MSVKTDSPYSTKFASGKINFELNNDNYMDIYNKEAKEMSLADSVLPLEFRDLPVHFGEMVANAIQAGNKIDTILKMENIPHREKLEKFNENIGKIVKYLVDNVDPLLDKFTIGAKNDQDEDSE